MNPSSAQQLLLNDGLTPSSTIAVSINRLNICHGPVHNLLHGKRVRHAWSSSVWVGFPGKREHRNRDQVPLTRTNQSVDSGSWAQMPAELPDLQYGRFACLIAVQKETRLETCGANYQRLPTLSELLKVASLQVSGPGMSPAALRCLRVQRKYSPRVGSETAGYCREVLSAREPTLQRPQACTNFAL